MQLVDMRARQRQQKKTHTEVAEKAGVSIENTPMPPLPPSSLTAGYFYAPNKVNRAVSYVYLCCVTR